MPSPTQKSTFRRSSDMTEESWGRFRRGNLETKKTNVNDTDGLNHPTHRTIIQGSAPIKDNVDDANLTR